MGLYGFAIVGAGACAGVLLGVIFCAIIRGATICGGGPAEQQKKMAGGER